MSDILDNGGCPEGTDVAYLQSTVNSCVNQDYPVTATSSDLYDNDQTYVKTLSPVSLFRGNNLHQNIEFDHSDYLDYPPLDYDGNLQCGQPHDTAAEYTAYKLSSVVYDHFDLELLELPKDLYISKLLELAEHCEETISSYRSDLATRARGCDNAPTGVLKDRRKSQKGQVIEKFAHDCYLLNRFILGNASDVDDLFKKPQPNLSQSLLRSSCPQTPKMAPDVSHDVTMLKKTVASLQSDVHLLRTEAKETKATLESFSSDLNNGLLEMKSELELCKNVLVKNLANFPCESSASLSNGLLALINLVNKIDSSRTKVHFELADLKQKIKDNSVSVENLRDNDVKKSNNLKLQMKDVEERIETQVKKGIEQAIVTADAQPAIKNIDSKLKCIEKKLSKSDQTATFDSAFEAFSKELSSKLDSLNMNIQLSLEKLTTANNTHGLQHQCPHVHAHSPLRTTHAESTTTTTTERDHTLSQDRVDLTLPSNVQNIPSQRKPEVKSPEVDQVVEIDINVQKPEALRQRSQDVETDEQPNGRHRFRGVIRKKAASYLLTGIDLDSDELGLEDFLEEIGVEYKTAKFLITRRTDCQSAQLIVSEDQSELVEDPDTWPPGITCRPWIKRSEYRKRYNDRHHNVD